MDSGGRSYGGSASAPSRVERTGVPLAAQRHDGLQPGQPGTDDDDALHGLTEPSALDAAQSAEPAR